ANTYSIQTATQCKEWMLLLAAEASPTQEETIEICLCLMDAQCSMGKCYLPQAAFLLISRRKVGTFASDSLEGNFGIALIVCKGLNYFFIHGFFANTGAVPLRHRHELKIARDQHRRTSRDAFAIDILFVLQTPIEGERATLLCILRNDLGIAAKYGDLEPVYC